MNTTITGYKLLFCNLFFAIILSVICLGACKKEGLSSTEYDYRRIAWNYLDSQSKATVISDWRKAPITYTQGVPFAPTYKDEQIAAVRFNTSNDAILGPIVVFVAVQSKTVVGVGLRD